MSENQHKTEFERANQAPVQVQKFKQSLCAMVDGEIAHQDMTMLGHQSYEQDWVAYHLIGDVMRKSDALTPVSTAFAARMSAALERESAHAPIDLAHEPKRAPNAPEQTFEPRGWRRWFSLPTLAITAAVASIVWVVQPMLDDSSPSMMPVQNLQASLEAVPLPPKAVMDDYIDAHRQLASPIGVQMASYRPGVGQ